MIIVAQPRHVFACARGRGKTGVTVTVTGLSLRCFSSSSIFNKTLREEPSLHRSEFPIHVHDPVFMALCRLSRVPWSEVEDQTSPLRLTAAMSWAFSKTSTGETRPVPANVVTKTPIGDYPHCWHLESRGRQHARLQRPQFTHICGFHTVGIRKYMCGIICIVNTKTPIGSCLTADTWSRGGGNTRGCSALTLTHICGCHTVGT